MSDLIAFDCPRCHEPAEERFYGPCSSCRDQLRTVPVEYAPHPHFVTANHQDGREYTAYVGPVEFVG